MSTSARWWLSLARFELRLIARSTRRAVSAIGGVRWYVGDYRRFVTQLSTTGDTTQLVAFPQLTDRTANTHFDSHYVHQGAWVFRHLLDRRPAQHIDIASYVGYLGFFSA